MRIFAVGIAAALLLLTGCAAGGVGIVAVVTDYGESDPYRGVFVAGVLRANPVARVVEITHDVEPFNIMEAAFVIAEAAPEFPAGTVIVGVVDPGGGVEADQLVVEANGGQTLVGPDNGILDAAIARCGGARAVWRVDLAAAADAGMIRAGLTGSDALGPIAGHLSRAASIRRFATRGDGWVRLETPRPERTREGVSGVVLRVDHYGNILTNIPSGWVDSAPLGTQMSVAIGPAAQRCTLQKAYGEVPQGALLVRATQSGLVEIARNRASAAHQLSARVGERVELRAPQ